MESGFDQKKKGAIKGWCGRIPDADLTGNPLKAKVLDTRDESWISEKKEGDLSSQAENRRMIVCGYGYKFRFCSHHMGRALYSGFLWPILWGRKECRFLSYIMMKPILSER